MDLVRLQDRAHHLRGQPEQTADLVPGVAHTLQLKQFLLGVDGSLGKLPGNLAINPGDLVVPDAGLHIHVEARAVSTGMEYCIDEGSLDLYSNPDPSLGVTGDGQDG